ncbi:hypothetical protein QUB75_04965 [Microcoleus sp. K1-B6]|uniref:hypothetical protein n=1 Tax=unclassified Microcoleus TaxID=2642155 RepID=UPI002FD3E0E9
MDNNLYQRIIQYARVIAGGDELPWSGLYTARSVYNLLKDSEPLYPEDIGTQLDLSAEYVNQIILALQNGGIEIKSVPTETINGRPRVKYTIDTSMLYYVLVSDQGLEVRFSKNEVLPDIQKLLGLDIQVEEKAFLEITGHQFIDKSLAILSNAGAEGEVNFVTNNGQELRGLLVILGIDANEKFFLISATQVKSVIPQLLRNYS